jgi:hypothetical protein
MATAALTRRPRLAAGLVAAALLAATPSAYANDNVRDHDVHRLQSIIDAVALQLGITNDVTAVVVQKNPPLVSVEPNATDRSRFALSFEDAFLDELDDDDLRAVIAHELGHVWIFTHHPFLQTERGANDVAQRVVSREHLARVYTKVWNRIGTKPDLERFLGQ